MGQQQLLLLVLSVIIVGVAVVVGIEMFGDSAATANLEAVTSDLLHLASRAQQYYIKPKSMGGGGDSFVGITLESLVSKPNNENGTFSISGASVESVIIIGVTKKGDYEVRTTVYKDRTSTEVTLKT